MSSKKKNSSSSKKKSKSTNLVSEVVEHPEKRSLWHAFLTPTYKKFKAEHPEWDSGQLNKELAAAYQTLKKTKENTLRKEVEQELKNGTKKEIADEVKKRYDQWAEEQRIIYSKIQDEAIKSGKKKQRKNTNSSRKRKQLLAQGKTISKKDRNKKRSSSSNKKKQDKKKIEGGGEQESSKRRNSTTSSSINPIDNEFDLSAHGFLLFAHDQLLRNEEEDQEEEEKKEGKKNKNSVLNKWLKNEELQKQYEQEADELYRFYKNAIYPPSFVKSKTIEGGCECVPEPDEEEEEEEEEEKKEKNNIEAIFLSD